MESSGAQAHEAGWYQYPDEGRGLRFYDGHQWTDHFYPPPTLLQLPASKRLSMADIILGTWLGTMLTWLSVWGLAQIDPDQFYWPVKFVVEDLPTFP